MVRQSIFRNKTKLVCILCMIAVVMLTACGSGDTGEAQAVCKYDLQTLGDRMVSVDTTLPAMKTVSSEQDNAELKFTALSDLDYELVDGFYYAYAEDGSAPEIAVICLKKSTDAAKLMESLKKHLSDRTGTMSEYAPDQVELVEKAVVTNQGAYVTMIVSEKNGLVQKEFKDAF